MKIKSRQDAIVRYLRRNGTSTVDELAFQVGASRRTVLRDIGALRDEGFVIHSDVGRGGGLQLDPQSLQMASRLTVAEVFALLISVVSMRTAGNLPFSEMADAGLAKIEKSLPADKVKDLRTLLERLHIGALSPLQDLSDLKQMDPDLLSVFEVSFLNRLQMSFEYTDGKGCGSTRVVEPQAMLILQPLWYLVAWDPLRDDFRHFRMDRIKKPKVKDGATFMHRHVPFEDDVCPFSDYVPRQL